MLLFDKQIDACRIGIWRVTENLDTLYGLCSSPDSTRREAEERFRSESRRVEWVAVRVLLRYMLNSGASIRYMENGAPCLVGGEAFRISISHTKGYVAIALTEKEKVGIDVERISRKVESVRLRFVGENEKADDLISLLLHWSSKESVFKAMGETEVDFLAHLHVLPFGTVKDRGHFQLRETKSDERNVYDVGYVVFDEFVLTFTSR